MTVLTFHDVTLPDEIEQGARGGPSFSTAVVSISSGAEQRNSVWAQSRLKWDIAYGIQYKEDYIDVLNFFYERRGKAFGFMFTDWSDYFVEGEVIGTGDGVKRIFHLTKSYGTLDPYVRYITRPVWDNVVVKVNGVVNNNWSQGLKGTIIFANGFAPAMSAVVTWDGDFKVPVRFDVDDFKLTIGALAVGSIDALNVIEVREDPNTLPIDIVLSNTVTSIAENTSTAARVFVADITVIDDDLGTNILSLSGTDAASFEIDSATNKLYIKAGVALNFEVKTSYSISIDVTDRDIGADPDAQEAYTLTVTNVNETPSLLLTNVVAGLALGASTASRVKICDIDVVDDALGTNVVSLSGTDAASFEIFTGDLYLKSGTSTALARHYVVDVDLNDAAIVGSPDDTEHVVLSIGVVAAEHVYDTAGDFTLTLPEYSTLEIEVWAAGCGAWGYSTGATAAPTAPGITRCQNDQTFTALERWRVEPLTMADNPNAFEPGQTASTAKMNSFGIGAALTASNPGEFGSLGYATARTAAPGRNLPSGRGGNQLLLDTSIVPGGAAKTATLPSVSGVASANGDDGTQPGAGGSGGVFKQRIKEVTLHQGPGGAVDDVIDAGAAGGGSGMFAKKTWTWGTAQSGVGADYVASAPVVGQILQIKVGAGGVGGAGTAAGGDGALGKVIVRIS